MTKRIRLNSNTVSGECQGIRVTDLDCGFAYAKLLVLATFKHKSSNNLLILK